MFIQYIHTARVSVRVADQDTVRYPRKRTEKMKCLNPDKSNIAVVESLAVGEACKATY